MHNVKHLIAALRDDAPVSKLLFAKAITELGSQLHEQSSTIDTILKQYNVVRLTQTEQQLPTNSEILEQHAQHYTAVILPPGILHINRTITLDATIIFPAGAVLSIADGVELQLANAPLVMQYPVFTGLGSVTIGNGTYSTSWYEGSSLNLKWEALTRGLKPQRPWRCAIPRPKIGDPAAIDIPGLGLHWRLTAPLDFNDKHSQGIIKVDGGISATPQIEIDALLRFSTADKCEDISFPLGLRLHGADSARCGVDVQGGARLLFPNISAHYINGPAVRFSGLHPEGTNDCMIGLLVSASNRGTSLELRPQHSQVRGCRIEKIEESGSPATGQRAEHVVHVSGTVRGLYVSEIRVTATKAGYKPPTGPIVFIESTPNGTPKYQLRFGGIHQVGTNNIALATLAYKRDQNIEDLQLHAGTQSSDGGLEIDLNGCSSALITNIKYGRLRIAKDCDTIFLNSIPPKLIDAEACNFLIDGNIRATFDILPGELQAIPIKLSAYGIFCINLTAFSGPDCYLATPLIIHRDLKRVWTAHSDNNPAIPLRVVPTSDESTNKVFHAGNLGPLAITIIFTLSDEIILHANNTGAATLDFHLYGFAK